MMNIGSARLLVVEDERHMADGIRENLEAEGYSVEVAYDGRTALGLILSKRYDLVLLDIMMPELDGLTVCKRAREQGSDVPVLFLTARSGVDARIRGLEAGGDDYLTKPFQLRELLLRVAAILRRRVWYRKMPRAGAVLRFGGNEVDFRAMRAKSADGRSHELTQKETMILKALVEREGEVVSRDDILDIVWGYDAYPSSRTIDNFIVRLRRRFEPEPERPRFIHTARGVGYRFTRGTEP
ncbi:MAG: response regulator transcription factor [Acidobacteriota bacterium]|nr:response regulator transcription factor [Acidobacteriota bacterium]